MKTKLLVLLSFLSLFSGCSAINNLLTASPDVSIKKGFDGNGIAVLSFAKIGQIPNDIGRITADKLSDALFLKSGFNVIDRSRVNDAQLSMEINSPEFLSAEQITKLGAKLKANYLILGRIHCIVSDDYFKMDEDKQLNISFRIVSVANQEIIGLASYSCKYSDNLVAQITDMTSRIVSEATK